VHCSEVFLLSEMKGRLVYTAVVISEGVVCYSPSIQSAVGT